MRRDGQKKKNNKEKMYIEQKWTTQSRIKTVLVNTWEAGLEQVQGCSLQWRLR